MVGVIHKLHICTTHTTFPDGSPEVLNFPVQDVRVQKPDCNQNLPVSGQGSHFCVLVMQTPHILA